MGWSDQRKEDRIMMPQEPHELFDFVLQVTEGLGHEYERIRKRATEDSGTAGDEGEENWAELLREWLPPSYRVVTKGRIIGPTGIASPQVDVIVLLPDYPTYLINKKLYLAGGIAAAFECKLTLKAKHLRKATATAAKIHKLLPPRIGTPYRELHSSIFFGLLAHSHSWTGTNPSPRETIRSHLQDAESEFVSHPRECLDIVCVADLGASVQTKVTFTDQHKDEKHPDECIVTGFAWHDPVDSFETLKLNGNFKFTTNPFSPIGTLLCVLLRRLAWENPSIRPIADYFRWTGLQGGGAFHVKQWSQELYSDSTRLALNAATIMMPQPSFGPRTWNEWAIVFF
jgi:hypothetical protein